MTRSWRRTGMATGVVVAAAALAASTAAASPGTAAAGSSHPGAIAYIQALRHKVKYVFVLYQENRSYDSLFGTYPGANGLYAGKHGYYRNPASLPGFVQPILTTSGKTSVITPFRIGRSYYAADTDDINHSHPALVAKMDLNSHGVPQMDRFALTEEAIHSGGTLPSSGKVSLAAEQYGELSMAYEDCNTVPLLWRWAHNFTLADHIFQDMTGPSTPGNLSIIGAQTGATQWVRHPSEAFLGQDSTGSGVPVLDDADPLWGSASDPNPPALRLPYNHFDGAYTATGDSATVPSATSRTQLNLTYATLPLTLQGSSIGAVVQKDSRPTEDLSDVRSDVSYLTRRGAPTVDWGWYQEGYGSYDDSMLANTEGPAVQGTHAAYITHHNGPQYFGYIANNPTLADHLHGLHDFYSTLAAGRLSPSGGVYYLKGGFDNEMGLTPADPDSAVQKNFLGDDDHPAYSDTQISDALLASEINAIAGSKYWKNSAIVVTWDDSEGDYDHVRPPVQSTGPDGLVATDGPRVPLLVISPYARNGYVDSQAGSQASVVKLVDTLFGRTPLAKLPDELAARHLGETRYGESNLGPADALTPDVTSLLSAFDYARLTGQRAPIAASAAQTPASDLSPQAQMTLGCSYSGVQPVTVPASLTARGYDQVPANFNPRPSTDPGIFNPATGTTSAVKH